MQIITKNEAKHWLESYPGNTANIERTFIIRGSSPYPPTGNDEAFCLLSSLEIRDDNPVDFPEGKTIDYYGLSGWSISNKDFEEMLKLIGPEHDDDRHNILEAITAHQSKVTGDMYFWEDSGVLNQYLDPDAYRVDKIVYIQGSSSEITAWLPFLTDTDEHGKTLAYCFLVDKEWTVRERYYRKQEQIYLSQDAEVAINEYFDIDTADDLSNAEIKSRLDEDTYRYYKLCKDNIDTLVDCFMSEQQRDWTEYDTWRSAIEWFIDTKS